MSIPRTVNLPALLATTFAALAPFSWLPRDAKGPPFLADDLRGAIGLAGHLTAISVVWFGVVLPGKTWLRTSALDKALAIGTIVPTIRALFIDDPYFLIASVILFGVLILGTIEWCLGDGLRMLVNRWILKQEDQSEGNG